MFPDTKNIPRVEFYYDGEFKTEAGEQIFLDYINRVFYQFHTKLVSLKPIEDYSPEEGGKE